MKTNIIANTTNMRTYLKYLCAVLMLICTNASMWGDSFAWRLDMSKTSTSSSGNPVNFSTAKNSSSTNPEAVQIGSSVHELRLYHHSGRDGGSITITPTSGWKITQVDITSSTNPTIQYKIGDGSLTDLSLSGSDGVYTATISSLSVTSDLTIQNRNTTNTYLGLTMVEVTYEVNTTGNCTYKVYNGSSYVDWKTQPKGDIVPQEAPPSDTYGFICWSEEEYSGSFPSDLNDAGKLHYYPVSPGSPSHLTATANTSSVLYALYGSGSTYLTNTDVPLCTKLDVPTGLTSSVSGSTVTLSWDAVEGAESYELYIWDDEANDYFVDDVGNVTTKTLTSVPVDTYEWFVRAISSVDDDCDGEWSGYGEYFEVVGCVNISDSTVTVDDDVTPVWNCEEGYWEATVSWDAVDGATEYRVQLGYYDTGTSSWKAAGAYEDISGTSKLFTGLTQGTKYKGAVAALNKDCDPMKYTATANSNEFTPTCSSVTGLDVDASNITINSAELIWDATGNCNTYTIQVKKHSDASVVWSQSNSANSAHILTGLESNTRYDVYMTATNGCGNSANKNDYYFTTEKNYANFRYVCVDVDLVKTDGEGTIMLTSAAGQKVKAARTLTLTVDGATPSAVVNISADDMLFYKSDGTLITSSNLTCDASGEMDEEITVAYNPTSYISEDFATPTITVNCLGNNLTFDNFVTARCLPDNFVIASKWGDNWYALPANCTTSSSPTDGVLLEVDDASDPTTAYIAANYTKYGMKEVASSRYAANGTNLTFVERLTVDANDQKALYNGSSTSVQVYGMWRTYNTSGSPDPKYEWTPSTTDLKDYTITSAAKLGEEANARTLSLNNSNVFGTLLIDKAYSGKVRLLPATFVDPAPMQVVEWKSNSVVVMYTGSGVTATTKVGSNDASSGQTLTTKKKDHGVFELTTDQALTGKANQTLLITILNGSSAAVGSKLLTIPAIVSGDKDPSDLVASVDAAAQTDVVILDGATLSALATKYTFKDITVYPGGKLVIGKTDKQLGMKSLTLRGGSSWGAAEYEYKYPQFVLNNATSGAFTNSAAVINYDYVTTKAQYYSFVLPYNGSTSTIKYPVDIYGSNVSASNTGSFEFQYYDGEARAGGGKGWATLEEPATLIAGVGYTFLGMPKIVDAYDGSDESHSNTRQTYGIHRIPMSVAATTVQSGETNSSPGKSTPISVTLSDKNNASGWVLVGNPFMSDVTGLSNTDIQVGKLVPTSTVPWDGKWEWDDTNPSSGQRFVVIPSNDGTTYESEEVSTAELPAFKNFFVQIKNGIATSLVIPASSRDGAALSPARFSAQEEKDIRLAVDLLSETRSDKVDLLINDAYSAGFDEDADFTKMMNSTNLNLYGVYPGDNLSFIAVDKTSAAGSIAIGYQVPAGGEYTLRLSDRAYVMSDYVDALLVTDHEVEPEVTTDLLTSPYEFHVNNAETNDTRFTMAIIMAPKIPTDIDIIEEECRKIDTEGALKFLYHDKIYILHHGVIYDVTGKKVREINK